MKTTANFIIGLFIVMILLIVVSLLPLVGAYYFVKAGHVGVVTRFGAVKNVVNPGLTFKLPIIDFVVQMETRTQKEQVEAQSASKDLQEVKSTIALNFHLKGEKAVDVYQHAN